MSNHFMNTIVVAVCLASLLIPTEAAHSPRSGRVHRRFTFVAQPVPEGWADSLEDYQQYHFRYLALGCHERKDEDFFDTCCHPRSKKAPLKNVPKVCTLDPESMVKAFYIMKESSSSANFTEGEQGAPVFVPNGTIKAIAPLQGCNGSEVLTDSQIKLLTLVQQHLAANSTNTTNSTQFMQFNSSAMQHNSSSLMQFNSSSINLANITALLYSNSSNIDFTNYTAFLNSSLSSYDNLTHFLSANLTQLSNVTSCVSGLNLTQNLTSVALTNHNQTVNLSHKNEDAAMTSASHAGKDAEAAKAQAEADAAAKKAAAEAKATADSEAAAQAAADAKSAAEAQAAAAAKSAADAKSAAEAKAASEAQASADAKSSTDAQAAAAAKAAADAKFAAEAKAASEAQAAADAKSAAEAQAAADAKSAADAQAAAAKAASDAQAAAAAKPAPSVVANVGGSVSNVMAGLSDVYGGDGGAKATYFYQEGGIGACGTANSDSTPLVALPTALYANGAHCGKNVLIMNTANGKSVNAKVQDMCPGCPSDTSLDLSTGAFNAIGAEATGVLPIQWGFTN